jgi:hypothetical protein
LANRFARLLKSYQLATKQPPPPGCILVHNRIDGSTRGFRGWWTKPAAEFVLCHCGWRPDLGLHYRVQRGGPLIARHSRYGVTPAAWRD